MKIYCLDRIRPSSIVGEGIQILSAMIETWADEKKKKKKKEKLNFE